MIWSLFARSSASAPKKKEEESFSQYGVKPFRVNVCCVHGTYGRWEFSFVGEYRRGKKKEPVGLNRNVDGGNVLKSNIKL